MTREKIAETKEGFCLINNGVNLIVTNPKGCEGVELVVVSMRYYNDQGEEVIEYDVLHWADVYSRVIANAIMLENAREAARVFADVLNNKDLDTDIIARSNGCFLRKARSDGRYIVDHPEEFSDMVRIAVKESIHDDKPHLEVVTCVDDKQLTASEFAKFSQYVQGMYKARDKFQHVIDID